MQNVTGHIPQNVSTETQACADKGTVLQHCLHYTLSCLLNLCLPPWMRRTWTCKLPPRAWELTANLGTKTRWTLQPHDSAGALHGIGNMASILNGTHQKTSINGARASSVHMEWSFALVVLGNHREVPRMLCLVALSYLSVHAKGLVVLRNTGEKLNVKVTRTHILLLL